MSVWCLDLHAPWRCRHSGACCSAGWTIPIEGPAYERVTAHFGPLRRGHRLFMTGGPLPEGAAAMLATRPSRDCIFFDREDGRLCAVHRELGPASLPVACRQFPRQVLQDPRGDLITLSHYCPTAAGLLIDAPPGSIAIVAAPPALVVEPELEGLDARGVMPPLLKPELLTDLSGYDAWERAALSLLNDDGLNADLAIGAIAGATAEIEAWRPDAGPLTEAVRGAFAHPLPPAGERGGERDVERFRAVLASIPAGLEVPELPAHLDRKWKPAAAWLGDHDRVVRAYLAAKLFGNWIAYYGRGLRTIVEYLRTCLAVLRIEAVRHPGRDRQALVETLRGADLLIVHLSDAHALARLITTT